MIDKKDLEEFSKQFLALGGTPSQLNNAREDADLMRRVIAILQEEPKALLEKESP